MPTETSTHDVVDVTHYADGIDCECSPDNPAELACKECDACLCETCETGHWMGCSSYV